MALNDAEIEQLEEYADDIEAGGVEPADARRKAVIDQSHKMGNPGPTDDQLEKVLRKKGLWDDTKTRRQNLSPH
ncbi:hypothetical protein [Paraburkholderia sp. GAS348]|uniref:hypothetical protein n=1 Tax=Paraburkholderia sp. GAS348 TaxID=3035132 RepID=UPI003D1DA83D